MPETQQVPVEESKVSVADEAAEAKLRAEKPFKCPNCAYRAKLPSLLSRHINHSHPQTLERNSGHLLTALEKKKSVPEMLATVADWIERGSTFDEYLPEDIISYLKKEDAKTQLLLRIIAIEKVQRALMLGEKIKSLDEDLTTKMSDVEWRKKQEVGGLLGLIERLQTLQKEELSFLKEISQMGQINLNDVIDKLVETFGTSQAGSAKPGGLTAFQLTGMNIPIPEDPVEREKLRKVLKNMNLEHLIDERKSGRSNKPIEATVEDSTRGNSKASQAHAKP